MLGFTVEVEQYERRFLMKTIQVNPVGTIRQGEKGTMLVVDKKYISALQEVEAPYIKAPDIMGIFATRSPIRPNPIALTASQVISIDHAAGTIQLAYIDANDGTPVLDIKPYTPSIDRVEGPKVPNWCSHWPNSVEQSGDFDWASEFNF